MSEIKRVKIQNFIETQIPEFLNTDNPLFKEFLEQYYISLEHQTGTVDLANNLIDYKKIDNFNRETFYNQLEPCVLTNEVRFFDTTISVNHTIGFPDKYGLLKIDNEIITYKSKTDTTFEDCIRGFSGIDKIHNKSFYGDFNFISTNAEDHLNASSVINLNTKFFDEIFKKFKYQFLPGFENRTFVPEVNLQTILSRAKDFYISKGTDTSYKILFKILYGEDIELIKPQEYMLRPSDNKYFVTKNILVERVLGDLDPLDLKGQTLYQNTSDGLASAAIYNVEIRPISNNNFLYEISLDPESIFLNFKTTKKTNVMESASFNSTSIIVDSTIGFPNSGELLVKSVNAPGPFIISYQEKTNNQFLGVQGGIVNYFTNDVLIENDFAYCSVDDQIVYFRIINVIKDLDYSNSFGMRIGDVIKLSSFGADLNLRLEFNSWLYNLPIRHNVSNITSTDEQNTWRIELVDAVKFVNNERLSLLNPNNPDDVEATGTVKRVINENTIEVVSGNNLSEKTVLHKIIAKPNVLNYPEANNLVSNIQNTYIDTEEKNFYVTSSGLPDYRVIANNRKILVSTPQNPDPTSGVGKTTTLNTNIQHKFYTGEKIYFTSITNLGISTGTYFVTALGNYNNSNQISLSYSDSDLFSKKYIDVSYGGTGEFVKLDYEFKTVEHQKLLRKFSLDKNSTKINNSFERTTNNRPIGMLLNGVELYSSTLYDENIYYGKLSSIDVVSGGDNYDVVHSPEINIEDSSGFGAKAYLNINGSVKGVKIVNPGFGYTKDFNISIVGGNGSGASLKANIIKTRTNSGFRGDGSGVNPTNNSISFILPHNFDDGEQIEYFSNSNREIEYSDPVSGEIRKLPSNSFYFAGVFSDTVIKLYRTKEDAANKVNEINLTTSPSFGFHYFRSLNSRLTLVDVSVENSGSNYSNKKVVVPAINDNLGKQNGIDVYNDTIFAKEHSFNNKDLVLYSTTGTPISGLSTESKYYVFVVDDNRFKLSLAGIGNSISEDNYNQNKYVRLTSVGVGTHTFSYPPIEIVIDTNPENSNGKLELPILEPIVTGPIKSVFIESVGEKYGVSNIINYHRRPNIFVNRVLSEAVFKPVIIDGIIVDVQILSTGNGYGNDLDIIVFGSGKFADIYPIVQNGRIISLSILNGGIGYKDSDTFVIAQPRGSGAKFLANVFEWKINQVEKNKFLLNNEDEGILVPSKNVQSGLQFIHFYPPKVLRSKLDDNLTVNNTEQSTANSSPILGWAYDGYPIYGPYTNIDNTIARVRSSYVKTIERNSNLRPTGVDFPDGFFVQDYVFRKDIGDLDEYNGKFIRNSDFPDGTYAYFFTIDVDNNGNSIPQYPYLISTEFKSIPNPETYDPNYNQDLNLNELQLIRNTSPYYLNFQNSNYGLLDAVEEKYKQEFIVKTISRSGIDSISIYQPGDGYSVGDILEFDNANSGGSGIYASVSKIKGKDISSLTVGISTYYPVNFVRTGTSITGIANTYHDLVDGDVIVIKNISSPLYKSLEGARKVSVNTKSVGLTTSILDLGSTGAITKIFVSDITGFSVDDYIKIDNEILRILNIIPSQSALRVERLSNSGVHTSGISTVQLLSKEFSFIENTSNIITRRNKRVYFNPEEVVGFKSTYTLENNNIITIPEKSIYIPNHSFFTGQPLTYHPGVNSLNLLASNSPGGPEFELETGQTVYAVNYGPDFLGISTVGYTTSAGIGTTEPNSVYFSSSLSGVGVAHSLTTQYEEIIGKVESYSINVVSQQNHELSTGDLITLSFTPEFTRTIKFRYDNVIKRITTDLIYFDSTLVDTTHSTLEVISDELNTGDKIVYYNEGNSSIGGLVNNQTYFVIKDIPNKIKLANYYSDSLAGNFVELTSSSTGNHSIAKVNPKLTIVKGTYVEFDLTDSSLSNLTLRLYRDKDFSKELEEYNYILNQQRYLRTSLDLYPREIYYSFFSSVDLVSTDTEVMNNNLIEIVESNYLNEYSIKVINDKSFKINLPREPETTIYNHSNLRDLYYSTLSTSSTGPIERIKLNYGGKNYSKVPKLSRIISENGVDATLTAKSNKIGRISSLERVKDGFDYPTDETLLPLMSVPTIVQVEGISRIDNIGIITGGRNYNTNPTLKVIGNDDIILQTKIQGSSVVEVDVIQNVSNLSTPLRVIPAKNSNGYSIDEITVNNNVVTLELLNSDNQLYPLINTGYGTTEIEFPFNVGDEIFIERCRLETNEVDGNGQPITKNNYNSVDYDYRFFTVTGINTTNYTVTYSMEGIADNLGTYSSDFGYGYVVNRKDMAEFEMNLINDLSYMSGEVVLGYDENDTNTFSAKVMENGWDNDLNQLRLTNSKGTLRNGYQLRGQNSLLNGIVADVNIFNLKSTLDVTRDKVNDLGDRVGFLNDFQQRISDNNYYQKFSYSIKGKIPYNIWREPVKSVIHPSGFKEFSDLDIVSISTSRVKVSTASSLELTVNIDNFKSLYTKNNFAAVTEEEQFEDGSIERIAFEEGVALRPYILSKTNKVIVIDDISSQFNGTTNLEIVATKPVTFISTDLYRLGVNTSGLNVGDKIGYSTYHFYPDSTYILSIGQDFIGISSDTPHKFFSQTGSSSSITQTLDFYRRIPGDKLVGISSFKLTSEGEPLFYKEFDASNGISTVVDTVNNSFIIPNHNFQTGQRIRYTPDTAPSVASASTTVGIGFSYTIDKTFDSEVYTFDNNETWLATFDYG